MAKMTEEQVRAHAAKNRLPLPPGMEPSLRHAPGLHCDKCAKIPIFEGAGGLCGCGGTFKMVEGPSAKPPIPTSAAHQDRPGIVLKAVPAQDSGPARPAAPRRAKEPNQTEARMLAICEARKRRGLIDSYRYEGLTLRWGRDPKTGGSMQYTPDVVTMKTFTDQDNPTTTIIEVKGAHIYSRDIVRFKGCRAEWPEFHFEMWQWKKGDWTQIL